MVQKSFFKKFVFVYIFLAPVLTLMYYIIYVYPYKRVQTIRSPVTKYSFSLNTSKAEIGFNGNLTSAYVDTSPKTMHEIFLRVGSGLKAGGVYVPVVTTDTSQVAIVVPFRDREEHLRVFLNHMHHFLQKQSIMYGVYVIEIDRRSKFNRGLLLNIGFVEAMKDYNYTCIVLHDVYLLPEDFRMSYTCPSQTTHFSNRMSTFNYGLPYPDFFGGVSALSTEHYRMVNGMTNIFFGWGGEDDDLYLRIGRLNLTVERPSAEYARYRMLAHDKDADKNPLAVCLLNSTGDRLLIDGLNSLKYTILDKELRPLYTWILVGVDATDLIEGNKLIHYFYQSCLAMHAVKTTIKA